VIVTGLFGAAAAKILKAGDPAAMKKELMILNAKGALDDSVVRRVCISEARVHFRYRCYRNGS
jgi:hypothetical protein